MLKRYLKVYQTTLFLTREPHLSLSFSEIKNTKHVASPFILSKVHSESRFFHSRFSLACTDQEGVSLWPTNSFIIQPRATKGFHRSSASSGSVQFSCISRRVVHWPRRNSVIATSEIPRKSCDFCALFRRLRSVKWNFWHVKSKSCRERLAIFGVIFGEISVFNQVPLNHNRDLDRSQ